MRSAPSSAARQGACTVSTSLQDKRRLAAWDALGFDIHGVDRLAGGHEQAIALAAAEAEVGAALGQQDAADQRAVRPAHGHTILSPAPPQPPPHIALAVPPDPFAE